MFTKLHNYEHRLLGSYTRLVFMTPPERTGGTSEYMKGIEANADLLMDARKTLKQADHYIKQYGIDAKSRHHILYFNADTVRLALKNDPEIRKARGNTKPEVYLKNKLRNLKAALKQVVAPLEKEKKKFTNKLIYAIYALPAYTKALRSLLSPKLRAGHITYLPKRFTFIAARFPGRTFAVLRNAKGEVTISFTKKGRAKNYPLCIAGKVVNRNVMKTIAKIMKLTPKERKEYAQAPLRERHLKTLQGKISKGRIAKRDIYPLLRVMKTWPKGIYKLPHKILRVRITAKNIILESKHAIYYSLYTGGSRLTMAQFASHGNTTEILPVQYRAKRPQGALAALHSSLVGPQYVKTKRKRYEVTFNSKREEAATFIHDIFGKPKDAKMIMVVKDKRGRAKYAAWDKGTWREYDWDNFKPSEKRLRISGGDAIVNVSTKDAILNETESKYKPKTKHRREEFEVK